MRHVGHGLDLLLQPQVILVAEPQQLVLVSLLLADGVDDQAAPRAQIGQGLHHRLPGRRRIDDRVQGHRGPLRGITRPDGPQLQGEGASLWVAGKDVDPGIRIEVTGQLQHQVGRAAEPGQSQRLTVFDPSQHEGAVADPTGAQQGRSLRVGEDVRYGIGIGLRHAHVLGVTPVDIAAGGPKVGTQVLVVRSGRGMDPADPDPLAEREAARPGTALVHTTDHLVARHHRQPRRGRASFDLVELGVADAAGGDFDPNFARHGLRHGKLHLGDRNRLVLQRADPLDDHRLHARQASY